MNIGNLKSIFSPDGETWIQEFVIECLASDFYKEIRKRKLNDDQVESFISNEIHRLFDTSW